VGRLGDIDPPQDIADLLTPINGARDGYYRAARGSLGVRGVSVQQSAALRQALLGRSAVTSEAADGRAI
jgi:hypothetical protein